MTDSAAATTPPLADQLDGDLDLRREPAVRTGGGSSGGAQRGDHRCGGGGGGQGCAELETAGGGEQLDGQHPGQAVDGPSQLAGRRPAHRHVVLLHGRAGDGVDRGRGGEPLELGDDRGLGVLGDHVPGVDPGIVGQEGVQTVVAGPVQEPVGPALGDAGQVGDHDGQEVQHVRDRRTVEVAVRLDPPVRGDDGVVDGGGELDPATVRAWAIVSRAPPATCGEQRSE